MGYTHVRRVFGCIVAGRTYLNYGQQAGSGASKVMNVLLNNITKFWEIDDCDIVKTLSVMEIEFLKNISRYILF